MRCAGILVVLSVAIGWPPEFSYDLYSDKQGHFSYDGAALALAKRPSHLQRIYADAARGEARSKSLVLELEYWFQQAGIAVADRTAALGCRVLPEFQPDCRPPNWEFIEQFLGDSPEAVRLREVLAEAYARRAYQLGVRNDVTVAGVNLLLAGSLAQAVLARVGVVEARAAGQQTLASEAKAAQGGPAVKGLGEKAAAMRQVGASPEQIARALHAERNALKVRFREVSSPEAVRAFEQRNLQKYGDPLGPSVDQLRASGRTWEQIIESAARPGGADLGF